MFLTAEKATIIGDIAREAFVFIGAVKEKQDDLYFEIYRSLFAASGFVCAAGNHTECLFVAAAETLRPFCFQLKRFFDAAVIFQFYFIGSKAVGTAVGEPLQPAAAC
ncbi:hypothetical protein [uncultured Phascolarctobacterium sp.]|uniref:hypothetical protein n=1 Tax=uncultured Phascolarctobacterium sp. TaxID=512296 RepID=UPI0025CD251F|nr:hypothetical protein [uncultured Phascolarctobacterium sp.]